MVLWIFLMNVGMHHNESYCLRKSENIEILLRNSDYIAHQQFQGTFSRKSCTIITLHENSQYLHTLATSLSAYLLFKKIMQTVNKAPNNKGYFSLFISKDDHKVHTYIHTYHSRFIPEGVAEVSQIFLREPHVLPKLVSCEEHCRRDRW
jgi:hypothetical protein